MIVAGEASGDHYAACLIKQLQALLPDVYCYGMGMAAMREAKADLLVDSSELATMGFSFLQKFWQFVDSFKRLKQAMIQDKPDMLVLIDYPDFNLRLAKVAHRLGIRVLYYISPKIWVWRHGRIKKIEKYVDDLVVIFPFEKAMYHGRDLAVHYFGHPALDGIPADVLQTTNPPANREKPHILLLPGSRPAEISNHLPVLCQTAALLQKNNPNTTFSLVIRPNTSQTVFLEQIKKHQINCTLVENTHANFLPADFALVCSGTASLQIALARTPMIIFYQVPFIYFAMSHLWSLKYIGLPNIILDKQLVPEIYKRKLDPELLCQQTLALLNNSVQLDAMQKGFALIREKLQTQGSVARQLAQLIAQRLTN